MKRKSIITTTVIILAILLTWLVISQFFKKQEDTRRNECTGRGGRWDSGLGECIPVGESNPQNSDDYIWRAAYDASINREYLIKGSKLDSYTESVPALIDLLNRRPAKCELKFVEQQGDTVRIKVINDEYLGERMGTTGAWCYMAETVVTLTENEAIRVVEFDMNAGSHASPGAYQRSDFDELILNLDSLVTEEMEEEFNLNIIE